MDRDRLIEEIVEAFFNDMLRLDEETSFEMDNPEFMKELMGQFVAGRAEALSDEELMTAFSDRARILDDWIAFLKARLETMGKTVH
jgi:hypothetical protein